MNTYKNYLIIAIFGLFGLTNTTHGMSRTFGRIVRPVMRTFTQQKINIKKLARPMLLTTGAIAGLGSYRNTVLADQGKTTNAQLPKPLDYASITIEKDEGPLSYYPTKRQVTLNAIDNSTGITLGTVHFTATKEEKTQSWVIYIFTLHVNQKFRHMGIGSKLMHAIIKIYPDINEVHLDSLDTAIRFYEKIGLQCNAPKPNEYPKCKWAPERFNRAMEKFTFEKIDKDTVRVSTRGG